MPAPAQKTHPIHAAYIPFHQEELSPELVNAWEEKQEDVKTTIFLGERKEIQDWTWTFQTFKKEEEIGAK